MLEEKPILFSAPMVRAILEGRKTQTRRIVKKGECIIKVENGHQIPLLDRCPYGQPGGKLWVRETFCSNGAGGYFYRATDHDVEGLDDGDGFNVLNKDGSLRSPWRPSIHMPRVASRITLDVVQIRVERLHDITEEDAKAEGAEKLVTDGEGEFYQSENGTYRTGFFGLWQHINGAESLESNPWVWVVEFKRAQA